MEPVDDDPEEDEVNSDEQLAEVKESTVGAAAQRQYVLAVVGFLRYSLDKRRPYLNPAFMQKYMTGLSPPKTQAGRAETNIMCDALVSATPPPPWTMKAVTVDLFGKYLNFLNGDIFSGWPNAGACPFQRISGRGSLISTKV